MRKNIKYSKQTRYISNGSSIFLNLVSQKFLPTTIFFSHSLFTSLLSLLIASRIIWWFKIVWTEGKKNNLRNPDIRISMYTNNTRWRYTGGQEDRHAWVGTRVACFTGGRSVRAQSIPAIHGPYRPCRWFVTRLVPNSTVTEHANLARSLMDFVRIRSVDHF